MYSESVYALSLDGRYELRTSNISEWEKAEKLPNVKFDVFVNKTKVNGDEVEFEGKSFKKSGQSWTNTAALPSPNGKWIAVFSHTSGKGRPNYGLWSGGGPGPGEMFIDIYEVSSSKKVLSGHRSHTGGDEPGGLFDDAFWVGSEYFVIPAGLDPGGHFFGDAGDLCLVGILPKG
jgi:hypothetical protein